ncbi:MAG: chalcone isomerase family protein [Pirellulaceae bacterium]
MWKPLILAAFAFVLASSGAISGHAHAANFPPQINAGEHRLVLNGEGARTKAFIELYEAALYLTQPSNNATEIIKGNQAMAIRIKITSGFVSQKSLVDSLEEGFKSASGGDASKIRKQIQDFRKCFREDIAKGDIFDLVYLPTHGVIVNKNGKLKGVVAGAEFKQALFSIWLSDKPADATLRRALLTTSKLR